MTDWKKKGILHQEIEMHMEKGQFKKALNVSQKLLNLDPKDCDTLYNMSIIYAHLGKLKKAEVCNQKILDINPRDADALINMAQVNELTGHPRKAEEYYLKALESGFSRIFRVEKLWNLALEKYKDDKRMLKNIADQCVFQGDIHKLIDLEARTKILGPENFKVASLLGSVLQKFQMLVSSPPALAPFPEMFFSSDEVWNELLAQLNIDLGITLFSKQGFTFDYHTIKREGLEKINTLSIKELLDSIIITLHSLTEQGKYEMSDQLFEKATQHKDVYDIKRIN